MNFMLNLLGQTNIPKDDGMPVQVEIALFIILGILVLAGLFVFLKYGSLCQYVYKDFLFSLISISWESIQQPPFSNYWTVPFSNN